MFRLCGIIFSMFIIVIAVSEIYPESVQVLVENNSNPEPDNKYNFDKNNYFVWIEQLIEKNKHTAQKLLNEFNAKYPNHREMKYYYFSALINESKNENIKAIENYLKAISINPAYSYARNNLGCLYLRLENYREAEEQLLKAVESNLYNPFMNYNLGDLYHKINKLDLAEKYYLKACQYKANYWEAFYKLGLIYYNKEQFAKALDNFNKALQFSSDQYEIYYYAGVSYSRLGQTDSAILNLKKSLVIRKDFFSSIVELGKIYQKYNEYKDAVKYFLLAESINCDDLNVRYFLCECYAGMKRYDDALEIIEYLIKRDPDNKKYLELLSYINELKTSEK